MLKPATQLAVFLSAFQLFSLSAFSLESPPLPSDSSQELTLQTKSSRPSFPSVKLQSPKAAAAPDLANAVMLQRGKLLISWRTNQTTLSLNSDSKSVIVLQKSANLKHWSPAVLTTGLDGQVTEIRETSTNRFAFYRTAAQVRSNLFQGSILGDVKSTPTNTPYIWPGVANYQQNFGVTTTNGARYSIVFQPDSRSAGSVDYLAKYDPARNEINVFYLPAFQPYGDNFSHTYFVTYRISGVPNNMAIASVTTNWTRTATSEYYEKLIPQEMISCLAGQTVGASVSTQPKPDGAGIRTQYYFPHKKRSGAFDVLHVEKLDYNFGAVESTMCQCADGKIHLFTQYDGEAWADELVLQFDSADVLRCIETNYQVVDVYGENTSLSCAAHGNDVWLASSAGETIQLCSSPFNPDCAQYPWFKVTRCHLNLIRAGNDTSLWYELPLWMKREEQTKVTPDGRVRVLGIYDPYSTHWLQRECAFANGAFTVTDCPDEAWQLCDGQFAGQGSDGGFTKWPTLQ